jgi:hypothetical protein
MAFNGKLHGKNGAIYVGGGISTGGIKVVNKTEWSLNLNRDYVDATTFGNTNKVYLVGLKDISGTYAGILDLRGDQLVNVADSGATQIYLYADDTNNNETGAPILVAHGPGLFDASLTASISDAIKVTGNFRASDNWVVFTSGTLAG